MDVSQIDNPLVSCLCITEKRPTFMPWLLYCFDSQTWMQRELLIIDSSPVPIEKMEREDVRIITVPPGTSIPAKRNIALQEAAGGIITWFDDDDWQHPNKLRCIVEAISSGALYAGSIDSWFLDLSTYRCSKFQARTGDLLFNSAGFLKSAVQSIRFNENILKASDTYWMREVKKKLGYNRKMLGNQEILFFWLCHNSNISNPAKAKHFSDSLDDLRQSVGVTAWGNTDEELDALRLRLSKVDNSIPRNEMTSIKRLTISKSSDPASRTKTTQAIASNKSPKQLRSVPVGLVIKATVMDAYYLDVMVRHMIDQANYPFKERIIIVDRSRDFKGKYHHRTKVTNNELDLILDNILKDGIVDRIIDVDMDPDKVREISELYFGDEAKRIPTHASTGGPIYASLFGMEALDADHVLQMDADVFFYTSGISWIEEALKCIEADPTIWLMMTHPGPPAGPIGSSLGTRNTRLAKYDQKFNIWRFQTATTRYFFCRKRKLHGRLRPVYNRAGIAPLEQMIGHALSNNGAYRGALGDLKSWHLHAWHHEDPFPQWAAYLGKLIESGEYPLCQRGNYDLRLDLDRHRREWEKLLQPLIEGKTTILHKKTSLTNNIKTSCNRETSMAQAKPQEVDEIPFEKVPIAVVIPVRNRAGKRLENTIASLKWQSKGPPAQIIVVSYGSEPEINNELSKTFSRNGNILLTEGTPKDPWNKSLALNIGIRATNLGIPFVMTMDADMILAPNFLEIVIERLNKAKSALILCRSSDLPQDIPLTETDRTLLNEFLKLKRRSTLRPQWGPGGIQAASRHFFFEIQGYDEDLLWWGAMDKDLVQRAKTAGLTIDWIEEHTTMLHQWHPRKHNILQDTRCIAEAKKAWKVNHQLVEKRSTTLKRNLVGWGEMSN